MMGTNPELFKAIYVTVSISARYKYFLYGKIKGENNSENFIFISPIFLLIRQNVCAEE